ncbi:MAG: TldD/PmbA family protein [Candidatus Bipolaricaulota bacterium]
MSSSPWLEVCQEGCRLALGAGANEAEAFACDVDEVTVTLEKHDLQIARASRSSTIGLRVVVDRRMGFVSTNSLDELRSAASDAVAVAKATPADPHSRLAEPCALKPPGGLLDPEASTFSARDAVRVAARILEVAEAVDRRVIVGDASVSAVRTTRALVTTRGAAAEETTTLFSHHVLVTAKDGERVSSMDFQSGAARRARDVDVEPTVRQACVNALDSLASERGETFRGLVILSPSAALDLLLVPILFQVNGRNALRGLTRWRASLGSAVASSAISLSDDGTIPGGIASASFDREGVPHAPLCLIDRGRLAAILHNVYSAAASGAVSTGHASGSASSPPLIGPTNLTLASGRSSLDEIIADTPHGLFVARFSGNVDPVSGDFSGVAKAARSIRNGVRAEPVAGTLVAGNVFEALRAVVDTSRESQQIFGISVPYVRVDDVSVTAG